MVEELREHHRSVVADPVVREVELGEALVRMLQRNAELMDDIGVAPSEAVEGQIEALQHSVIAEGDVAGLGLGVE